MSLPPEVPPGVPPVVPEDLDGAEVAGSGGFLSPGFLDGALPCSSPCCVGRGAFEPSSVRPGAEGDPASARAASVRAPVSLSSELLSTATVAPAAASTTVRAAAASRPRDLRRGGRPEFTGRVGAEALGPVLSGSDGPEPCGAGPEPYGPGPEPAAPEVPAAPKAAGVPEPGVPGASWGPAVPGCTCCGGPNPGGTAGTLRSVSGRGGEDGAAGPRSGDVGVSVPPVSATDWSSSRAWSASGRASGRLSSNRWRTGASGPARSGSGSGSVTIAVSVENVDVRRKGEAPSTAAYSVAPRAQMSEAGPGSAPWARSGAR